MKILIVIVAVLFDFSANFNMPDSQSILWKQEVAADQPSSRDVWFRLEAVLVNGRSLKSPKWIVTRIFHSPLHRAQDILRDILKLNHLISTKSKMLSGSCHGCGDTIGPEGVRQVL